MREIQKNLLRWYGAEASHGIKTLALTIKASLTLLQRGSSIPCTNHSKSNDEV